MTCKQHTNTAMGHRHQCVLTTQVDVPDEGVHVQVRYGWHVRLKNRKSTKQLRVQTRGKVWHTRTERVHTACLEVAINGNGCDPTAAHTLQALMNISAPAS